MSTDTSLTLPTFCLILKDSSGLFLGWVLLTYKTLHPQAVFRTVPDRNFRTGLGEDGPSEL